MILVNELTPHFKAEAFWPAQVKDWLQDTSVRALSALLHPTR